MLHPANQPHVYRLRRGWFVFLFGLGLLPALAGIAGCVYFGTGHEVNSQRDAVMMVTICAAFACLGAYVLALSLRARLTLTETGISYRQVLGTKHIKKASVAGWRTNHATTPPLINLLLNGDGPSKLQIMAVFETDLAFEDWLASVPNLDIEEQVTTITEVLKDETAGGSADERLESLAKARKFARAANLLSAGLGVWAFFWPEPYMPLMWGLVLAPWVLLGIVAMSRGLIRVDQRPNDVHPSIALGMILSLAALLMRAVMDFDVVSYWMWVLWGLILTIALSIAAVWADPSLRRQRLSLAAFALLNLMYGFGAALCVNVLADGSEPALQQVLVSRKDVSTYKGTHYRLHLAPWGTVKSESTVEVGKRFYDSIQPGQPVCVSLYQGALGIEWFAVYPCN
jgi:hypothetical protein